MHTVTISDRQSTVSLSAPRIRHVVVATLHQSGVKDAQISVALVGDDAIHVLNRRHLAHDYPTDVLSFVLSGPAEPLEAEVVVSTDTALREAARFGWDVAAEVCLYVVHGVLHACGHDDHTPAGRAAMRRAERAVLKKFGLSPQYAARRAAGASSRPRPRGIIN